MESESLKFYFAPLRDQGAFHECCPTDIANKLIAPIWLRIGAGCYPKDSMPIDTLWQNCTHS